MGDVRNRHLDALPVTGPEPGPDTVRDNTVLAASHADGPRLRGLSAALSLAAPTRGELRRIILRAAYVGVREEPSVHYTEGAWRWSGITMRRRSWPGQAPPYADCSSFVTWCYWDASRWLRLPDFLNGADWTAGYTGTLTQHGVRVSDPQTGDLVFYGDLWVPYHVALYIGGGRCVSHGGEAGPQIVGIGSASQFRRYVL